MRGTEFAELNAFVAVAEEGSFTKASARLGLALPTVSQMVRALEERLGVRLLNRTTRSVAPTEAGERLLTDMHAVLTDIDRALEGVNSFRDTPRGTLRLAAMRPAASLLLAPLIPRFLAEYPNVSLEVAADDSHRDIVSGRFDAGVRIDQYIEKDMIAIPILREFKVYAVASPEYLKGRPIPKEPADLREHVCVRIRWDFDGVLHNWDFRNEQGESVEIAVNGPLIVNDVNLVLHAVLDGVGIGHIAHPMIAHPLEEGRLVRLLGDWTGRRSGLFLYYPSRRQIPAPLRAFITFIERYRPQIIAGEFGTRF